MILFFFLSSIISFTPSFSSSNWTPNLPYSLSIPILLSLQTSWPHSHFLSFSFQSLPPFNSLILESSSTCCQSRALASLCCLPSLILSSYFTGDFFHFCLNSTHPFGPSTYHYQSTFTLFSYFFLAFLL